MSKYKHVKNPVQSTGEPIATLLIGCCHFEARPKWLCDLVITTHKQVSTKHIISE